MLSFQPGERLRGHVASLQLIEGPAARVSVLPTTAVVLAFQYEGRIRAPEGLLSTAGVTGLQRRTREYQYVGATSSVMVRFTPSGAACLGVPVDALSARSEPLTSFLPRSQVAETSERVLSARTDAERLEAVERFLTALPYEEDALVTHAVSRLGEGVAVAPLARELGVSERQLERRFRARVGVSPRQYVSLRRFEQAVRLARSRPTLTEAALDAGYYDQSHFIRDVRRFTGKAPRSLMSDSSNS